MLETKDTNFFLRKVKDDYVKHWKCIWSVKNLTFHEDLVNIGISSWKLAVCKSSLKMHNLQALGNKILPVVKNTFTNWFKTR